MASQQNRNGLQGNIKRIVIKAGSRILVDEHGRPNLPRIEALAGEIAGLQEEGYEVIMVSSGAIAAGVEALGWRHRPTLLPDLQMAAAVGQSELMNRYGEAFARHRRRIGQILLIHADLNDRGRHLNARNTILAMLRGGVIPIVNENDVVSVDEIRFGDNDVLASMVAALVDADMLLLLTTSDGLYQTEAGRMKERIPELHKISSETLAMAEGKGSRWSSGGMASKLKAARRAAQAGTSVVIAGGFQERVISRVLNGEDTGTLIHAEQPSLKARKKWIAFFHRAQGSIGVDEGAADAIRNRGNSLLAVGIRQIEGKFRFGALVNIKNPEGEIIARGLTAYASEDLERIRGYHTEELPAILGESGYGEVIHRDNMVVMEESL